MKVHEANKRSVVRSTGDPAMDALNLADDIRDGVVTDKEAIAVLRQISKRINEEREGGETELDQVFDLLTIGGTLQ